MGNSIYLGIDPGIANTGLAVFSLESHAYTLQKTQLITSTPKETESVRLLKIFEGVYEVLNTPGLDITVVAIERVYHNKNVSSSIKTEKVIGAAICAAAQWEMLVIELTPQQVKSASGLGAKVDKTQVLQIARRIFLQDIPSHHEADAALCALCGCLQARTVVP